jgi:predicted SprT family Zn-dependent metalloprotease
MTKSTTLAEVIEVYAQLSNDIIAKYPQLKNWTFRWNHRLTNAMGRCVVKKGSKYIELSNRIVALNIRVPYFLDKIKDTIIHEWAHALEYEERKALSHSPVWRKWMMELGRRPERCYNGDLYAMIPRGATHLIRNSTTGRIFKYYNCVPSALSREQAFKWHHGQLMRPVHEDLEVVNLETGVWSRIQ